MSEQKQPLEFEQTPPEHSIPKEYPEYIPTKKKKRKGVNPMLVYGFVGLFVLNMSFGYLFPEYDPKQDDYWEENGGWVDPWQPTNPIRPNQPSQPQELPTEGKDNVFENYRDAFLQAASQFEEDDYIGAAAAITEAVNQRNSQYSVKNLRGTNQVYKDGAFSPFNNENLTGNQGIYFWVEVKDVHFYDEKAGSYWEEMAITTMIRLGQKNGDRTPVSLLQVYISVSGLEYGFLNAEGKYLEAELDSSLTGTNAMLTRFTITESYEGQNENYVRGDWSFYGIEQVEGDITLGEFSGYVTMRSQGMMLNEDKTQMQIRPENANEGWIYSLSVGGRLNEGDSIYADLTGYDTTAQEYQKKREEILADPNYSGYRFVMDDGSKGLFLDNISDRDGAWDNTVYEWDDAWYSEVFPLEDILHPWSVLKEHI